MITPRHATSAIAVVLTVSLLYSWDYFNLVSTTTALLKQRDTCALHGASLFQWPSTPPTPRSSRPETAGAVIVAWVGVEKEVETRWKCQLKSQRLYSQRHGYSFHLFTRIPDDLKTLPLGWFKVWAIRKLLPKYQWVLYLDTDTVFTSPDRSPAAENVLHDALFAEGKSVMVPEAKGWNSDTIFIRNSAWGSQFIERLWDLRHMCPDCVMEQCAVHVALLDSIIAAATPSSPTTITVSRDQWKQCCTPQSHCQYPHGTHNHAHSVSVQGCTWAWQEALGYPGTNHTHLHWMPDFRTRMMLQHPVKSMEC